MREAKPTGRQGLACHGSINIPAGVSPSTHKQNETIMISSESEPHYILPLRSEPATAGSGAGIISKLEGQKLPKNVLQVCGLAKLAILSDSWPL
jgi:hypothetical protein